MLASLIQYARDEDLAAAPGLTPKDVRWAVLLAADGRFTGVVELGDTDSKRNRGRKFLRAPSLTLPEMKRGGSGTRHFLVDNAEVVARLTGDGDPKVDAKHEYFIELLRRAGTEVPMSELGLCAGALSDPETERAIRQGLLAQGAKPTENVTFAVAGSFPVDSTAWHDWWRAFRAELSGPVPTAVHGTGDQLRMRCLASGELVVPVRTHLKIRGLADVGGISMGDALISFKQDSFRSYGLVQAENAAVSEEMVATYQAALNHLLENRSYRLGGEVRVVYWYPGSRIEDEDDLLAGLLAPEALQEQALRSAESQARRLLAAIDAGERPDLLQARYVSWVVSGASGRVMVRDFTEGSFRDLSETVTAWFDDLAIVDLQGDRLAPAPRFWQILGTLAREKPSDLPGPTVAELYRAALRHNYFPAPAAVQTLLRVRTDIVTGQPLRAHRFGVLKAYLLRLSEKGNHSMQPGLNPDQPEASYHCGRLMAILAVLQRRALGDVGAGVVQRYYAAASATPGLVIGRLLRTAQFHLEKLDPGLRHWHESRIADATSRISAEGFPDTLDLSGQSRFALGYYHQLADDRRKKAETAETTTEEGAVDA